MKKKNIEHFDIKNGFDPKILKTLNEDQLRVLCSDLRNNVIENCSINGGHLSSNLGVVELTVAIHHFFNLPTDKLIFDVGHQCYTHKLLSGRSLEKLRKVDGVAGFQKMDESEYDPYEAGHSSTSLSAAMGLALTRDLNGDNYNVIALIGDSSIANGVAFEAFNQLGNFDHKIIVILNDNDRSISKSYGLTRNYFEKVRLSKRYIRFKTRTEKALTRFKITKPIYYFAKWIKDFVKYHIGRPNLFRKLGLYYIPNIDGHDIKDMERAFKYAVNAPKTVIIHVATKKGRGYEYAEKDKDGYWHGVEPFDIKTGKSIVSKPEGSESWSNIYASLMREGMESDDKMIIINPATTVGSGINKLFMDYKDRCFDVGISEEHAAIFASGIAVGGYHPYYSVYSTFLQRGYDEISHDIARMNLNVTLMIDRCGLPNSDGETHQGVFDVAYLMSIPNIAICMAKDNIEAKQLFEFSKEYTHPLAIRYPKDRVILKEINEPLEKVTLGEWKVEQDGSKAVIITYGPITEKLINRYKDVKIVNALFQYPVDKEMLKSLLNYKNIILYDIYSTKTGFSEYLASLLLEMKYQGDLCIKAIPDTFIKHGSIESQLKRYELDLESLDKVIEGMK